MTVEKKTPATICHWVLVILWSLGIWLLVIIFRPGQIIPSELPNGRAGVVLGHLGQATGKIDLAMVAGSADGRGPNRRSRIVAQSAQPDSRFQIGGTL